MRGDDTAAFLAVNRNKRSLTLDLKDERHQAVLHRLVRDADVVLENYRPGVAARLGADWETLSERQPAAGVRERLGLRADRAVRAAARATT